MNSQHTIPGAIIIAGILVAGAIMISGSNTESNAAGAIVADDQRPSSSTDNIRPVTSDDHIFGNPNAPVKIVEYSDFECPFCKRFHDTMNSIMESQIEKGEVAWVFRHFPLDQLHPKNARRAAVASECANELGGNDAFWEFTNGWFELSPTNDRTDFDVVVSQLVKDIGLNKTAFDKCLTSGKYDDHVQEDLEDAIATGGSGTPWSVVIAPNGRTFSLSGAQPLSTVEQLIDLALREEK